MRYGIYLYKHTRSLVVDAVDIEEDINEDINAIRYAHSRVKEIVVNMNTLMSIFAENLEASKALLGQLDARISELGQSSARLTAPFLQSAEAHSETVDTLPLWIFKQRNG